MEVKEFAHLLRFGLFSKKKKLFMKYRLPHSKVLALNTIKNVDISEKKYIPNQNKQFAII